MIFNRSCFRITEPGNVYKSDNSKIVKKKKNCKIL